MKQLKIRCQYCGAPAKKQPDSVVHGGKARGVSLYICSRYPECNSYVGVHANSGVPLGTLANPSLRHKRRRAHEVFDTLWRSGQMDRNAAYRWMQAVLGLGVAQAHIGRLSEEKCDALIAECEKLLSRIGTAA